MTDSLTAVERETIVTMNDSEPYARIWTAQRKRITRLDKNPAARLIDRGTHGRTPWAEYEMPKDLVSFHAVRRGPTRTSGQGFPSQPSAPEHEKRNSEPSAERKTRRLGTNNNSRAQARDTHETTARRREGIGR